MSQKDYIAMASALKRMKPSQADIEMLRGEYNQWCSDVQAVAQVFAADNHKFHWPTFNAACGYTRDMG
jgi:hypothetical protein